MDGNIDAAALLNFEPYKNGLYCVCCFCLIIWLSIIPAASSHLSRPFAFTHAAADAGWREQWHSAYSHVHVHLPAIY